MRRFPISLITPSNSPSVPSTIDIVGTFTSIFHGKEWIDELGTRYPFYTYDRDALTVIPDVPYGTTLLVATTFQIVENEKYDGKYTVYTKPNAGGLSPSEVILGNTRIRINEPLAIDGVGAELTSGFVTNVSTYLLVIEGEPDLVVLEQAFIDDRPIKFPGKFSIGWGETFLQNQVELAQSFAGVQPVNPFVGQLWYDTPNELLKVRTTVSTWAILSPTPVLYYKHEQSAPSNTWTINHNFGLSAPFLVTSSFFVDIGGGVYKTILPADIVFAGTNYITVTFSSPYAGYAIIRD